MLRERSWRIDYFVEGGYLDTLEFPAFLTNGGAPALYPEETFICDYCSSAWAHTRVSYPAGFPRAKNITSRNCLLHGGGLLIPRLHEMNEQYIIYPQKLMLREVFILMEMPNGNLST